MADVSFLIDTDVLIDFFRGNVLAADWLSAHNNEVIGIPVIVLMELLQGARSPAEQVDIQRRLSRFSIQHLQTGDTERAAQWFATYRLSHGIGIMDCLIASVAVRLGVALYTFNTRHFTPIPGVQAPEPYSRTEAPGKKAGVEGKPS